MLYTASYFEPQRHHGKLISISRSIPKNFRVHSRLEFFIPSADLLRDWKAKRIDEAEYTNRYREQIRANLKPIKAWLERLDPKEDQTLLCWEKSGIDETLQRWQQTGKWQEKHPFCHRNLAIKLVEKFRPDCYGGQDVINYPMPVCRQWGLLELGWTAILLVREFKSLLSGGWETGRSLNAIATSRARSEFMYHIDT